MKIEWKSFLDKVYGCWIGKCVSGTIGAPYEGYKGMMDVEYTPELFATVLPNDDLDLQVLWLEVVEKVGVNFTSADLAKAFYEKCPYAPGEYATFKKNYELGLMPPLTGKFNNNYYIQGMGCPIRSEIWACLAPCDPELAIKLASMDGVLDHSGESVIAEQYLAALESMAFLGIWDVSALVVRALDYISKTSKFYALVSDIVEWCDESNDPKYVFGLILRKYGHADCTNMFQNMGITIMSLLLGKGDFIETTMIALNCGFDTDCTCATVGSVIGIIKGGKALMKEYNLSEQTYALSVNCVRRSNKVYDLAEDTALAAILFTERNSKCEITDYPRDMIPSIENTDAFPLSFSVSYPDDCPVIAPGESMKVEIKMEPVMKIKASGTIAFSAPEGFSIKPAEKRFKVGFFDANISVTVSVAKDIPILMQKNIINCTVTLDNGNVYNKSFGVVGASLWRVYGPFWENTSYAPPPKALQSYYASLPGGKDENESITIVRQFHLNAKPDKEKEYLEEQLLGEASLDTKYESYPAYIGFTASLKYDKFSIEDIMDNTLPCVIYMVRDVYAADDMTVCMQIGHSDAFRLWKDGDLLCYSDSVEHWTPENIHVKNITLKKGLNRFVIKLSRYNVSDFSIMFTKGGACTEMISTLGSGRV